MAAMRNKYDSEAAHIMMTIERDYMAIAKDNHDFDTKRTYYVCKHIIREKPGQAFDLRQDASTNSSTLCPFPKQLKECIQCLGDAAFLQIKFNPEDKRVFHGRHCCYPWSFTVDIPTVTIDEADWELQ